MGTTWLARAPWSWQVVNDCPRENPARNPAPPRQGGLSSHSLPPGPRVRAHTLERSGPDPCLVLTIKYWLGSLKFRNDLGAPRRRSNVLCPAALWAIYLLSASSKKLTESIPTCLKTDLTHFLPLPLPGAVVGVGQPERSAPKLGPGHPGQWRQGSRGAVCFHSLHGVRQTSLLTHQEAKGLLTELYHTSVNAKCLVPASWYIVVTVLYQVFLMTLF